MLRLRNLLAVLLLLVTGCSGGGIDPAEEDVSSTSEALTWSGWTDVNNNNTNPVTVFSADMSSSYRRLWFFTISDSSTLHYRRMDEATGNWSDSNWLSVPNSWNATWDTTTPLTAVFGESTTFWLMARATDGKIWMTPALWSSGLNDFQFLGTWTLSGSPLNPVAEFDAAMMYGGTDVMVVVRHGTNRGTVPETMSYEINHNNFNTTDGPYDMQTLPYPTQVVRKPELITKFVSPAGMLYTDAYIRDGSQFYQSRYLGNGCTPGPSCWTSWTSIALPTTYGSGSNDITVTWAPGNNTCQFMWWRPADALGQYTDTRKTWYRCSTYGSGGTTETYTTWTALGSTTTNGPQGPNVPAALVDYWNQRLFIFESVLNSPYSMFRKIGTF